MNEILEFIKRRFSIDCNWTSGNCYYFALILHDRFNGEIIYDLIDGHFLVQINKQLYDWTGWRADLYPEMNNLVKWKLYCKIDPLHYNRIIRDCIM